MTKTHCHAQPSSVNLMLYINTVTGVAHMGIQQTDLDANSHPFHPQPESCSSQDNQTLVDEITLLAGQINAANYRFLKLIAEYDRREAWADFGIRSCAHWLNWKCGIALGAAREKVRVARCLDDLPGINEAFAIGEISYSKVRAMTRVATDDNEDYLLMIARHGTAQQMEQLVRKYQQVTAVAEPGASQTQHEARELLYYQDEQGMWVIRGRLPAEAGALVVKAIEEALDTMEAVDEEAADSDNSDSSHTTDAADPEQENVPAETFTDYVEANCPEVDKDTAVSRWAGERMHFDMAVEGLMH